LRAFEGLVGLAVLFLMLGCLVDGTELGNALVRALDRVTSAIQSNQEVLIRAVCGFFFVTLWSLEGILLTPELETTSAWIPWLQLAIAAGLIWRRTMPLSGLGIAVLFVLAVRDTESSTWRTIRFSWAWPPIWRWWACNGICSGCGPSMSRVIPRPSR
jgi:hypothetical protein